MTHSFSNITAELLRRTFSRWFSAAKTVRHRRLLLTEREEDMKLVLAERAWDKWRERFSAERLRPLVSLSGYLIGSSVINIVLGTYVLYSDTKNATISSIPYLARQDDGGLSRLTIDLSSNVNPSSSQFPQSNSFRSEQRPSFGKNGAKRCQRQCKH